VPVAIPAGPWHDGPRMRTVTGGWFYYFYFGRCPA
jgi:hypothetical protein